MLVWLPNIARFLCKVTGILSNIQIQFIIIIFIHEIPTWNCGNWSYFSNKLRLTVGHNARCRGWASHKVAKWWSIVKDLTFQNYWKGRSGSVFALPWSDIPSIVVWYNNFIILIFIDCLSDYLSRNTAWGSVTLPWSWLIRSFIQTWLVTWSIKSATVRAGCNKINCSY